MTHVEIIAVGDELLRGRVLDSNSNWLAKAVTDLGREVTRSVAVRDQVEEIAAEVCTSISHESGAILTTGGLGPTVDDRTLEAVSGAIDRPFVIHDEALEWLVPRYERLKREGFVDDVRITPAREKIARLPDGATPLPNPVGAAPGMMVEARGRTIFSLPGVPAEMKAIFEGSVRPRLAALFIRGHFVERNVTTNVRDESQLVPIINEVMSKVEGVHLKSKPTHFGSNVHIGIRLTASGPDRARLLDRTNGAIHELDLLLARHNHTIIDYGVHVESPPFTCGDNFPEEIRPNVKPFKDSPEFRFV